MGKFSYKKRKGMKKQSFKNRKKTGGTGGNDEKEAAPVVQEESAPVVDGNTSAVEEESAPVEQQTVEQNDTSNDQNITPEDGNISTSSQEANVENNSDSTQQGDSDETTTLTVEELQSEPLTTQDENALKQVNDLDTDKMKELVKQFADDPNAPIPSWARAAIKSGAVGPLVDYLNNNTELKTALEKRVMDAIQDSGSGGPGGPVGQVGQVATSENTPLGTETNTDNIQKKYEDWIGQLANNNNSDGIKGILSDCVFVPISKITYIQDDNKKWIDPINSSGASATVEMSSTDNDAGAGTTAATGPDNAPGNTSDASTTETSSARDAANVETDTSGDTAGDTAGAADTDTSTGNSANTEMSSTGDAATGDATTMETNVPATTTTSEPPQ